MSAPVVSVVITAFNRVGLIGEAIESVLAQSFSDLELIVCDDHSTDGTVDLARALAARDPRIRIVENDRNVGDYPNRNRAAAHATGRFLKYHDSDDVMYPHCLEVIVRALESQPTAAFALSGSRSWPGGPVPMLLTPRLAYEREFIGGGLFNQGPSAALFRTAAFHELGGFPDAGAASDYLFWLRACARVNVALAPGDLFYYRIHEGQELSRPRSRRDYVRAGAVAWSVLNSADCPLDASTLAQAKRNFVFSVVRGAYRRARRGDLEGAVDALRHGGPGMPDLLRYCRPPRRVLSAGTPLTGPVTT